MKKNNYSSVLAQRSTKGVLIFTLMLLLVSASTSFAQQLRGKVIDKNNGAIIGASVVVKGTSKGTTSGQDGRFSLDKLSAGTVKLSVSFVGYATKEVTVRVPQSTEVEITLVETEAALEEVVVTGVFDQRKRIDASVAISTITARELRTLAPVSAADLLKNIPGVFVNSSVGEVDNQVTVRGTPTVNRVGNDNSSGYFYVSMQEDGLPVSNLTGGGIGPDFYLRADVNLKRVEAVRGGSASITGSDAPGGLFNYVSKEGGPNFEATAILKYGFEGNTNPYFRADLGFGGALNANKDMTYYVGGFYRKSDGARYPGFSMNNGGQVRANLVKTFKGGKVKLYAKLLDDRNGTFDFLPYTNFNNPQIASGFKDTDTFVGSGEAQFNYRYFSKGPEVNFNPKDLIHNKEKMVGLQFEKSFENGWKISNNFKYSNKSSRWNMQYVLGVGTTGIDATGFPGIWGNVSPNTLFGTPRIGTLSVKNALTGEEYYRSTQTARGVFSTQLDKLPNSGFIFGMGNALNVNVDEIIDQLEVHKQVGKSNFTFGTYFGRSKVDHESGFAGQYLSTLENRPSPLDVSITAPNGTVTQVTTPFGYKNNGIFYAHNILTNNRLDVFFGQTSPIGNKFTLDYGFRYNYTQFVGNAEAQSTSQLDFPLLFAGGYDKNPLTEYDNLSLVATTPWSYDRTYKSLSFSSALNYKINDKQAVYVRYSIGQKAPDISRITQPRTKESSEFLYLEPIKMTQVELSYKVQTDNFNLFVTPFYSQTSNLAESAFASDTVANTFYNTPPVYSKQRSIGIELESNVKISANFNVRGNLTLQDPKSVYKSFWDVGNPGKADDKIIEVKDASIPLTPKVLFSITPSYNTDKFNTSLSWRYVGKSPANSFGAFDMSAYNQLDFAFGYNITKNINANFNINNVLNTLGVTGWYPPGGFPASTMPENFTKAQREANPNAVWGARTTQPRAFYLTISYNFN